MQSSVGIRERIDHVYPSLRPAERAVAQYIRNHIEEAADLTVGQMADIAHVSQPTVIRFARKLGFGGYRELRYVLRNPAAEHKVTFNPLAGFDLNPWDGEDEIPGKAADGAKALIDELHSALDPKAYRKAVALLAESEFIDIFGVENSLTPAMDLFTKLGYLGLTCRLNTDAYLQQIGAIGDSDDAADYLPDAIVCVDTVGSIPQGWVEGLTVAAVACLIYAIVVLIRILCGKYEQEKLPDITFELVDMTPETEAKPETAPEADSAPEAEPEAEAAQPEKSEETEDTPDA